MSQSLDSLYKSPLIESDPVISVSTDSIKVTTPCNRGDGVCVCVLGGGTLHTFL